jgi:hypothetical protein
LANKNELLYLIKDEFQPWTRFAKLHYLEEADLLLILDEVVGRERVLGIRHNFSAYWDRRGDSDYQHALLQFIHQLEQEEISRRKQIQLEFLDGVKAELEKKTEIQSINDLRVLAGEEGQFLYDEELVSLFIRSVGQYYEPKDPDEYIHVSLNEEENLIFAWMKFPWEFATSENLFAAEAHPYSLTTEDPFREIDPQYEWGTTLSDNYSHDMLSLLTKQIKAEGFQPCFMHGPEDFLISDEEGKYLFVVYPLNNEKHAKECEELRREWREALKSMGPISAHELHLLRKKNIEDKKNGE